MRHNIAVRAGCLALLFALCFSAVACKKITEAPISPGLSLIEGYAMNEKGVALRTEHYSVSEGTLAYFFYGYGLEIMQKMEERVAYDESKSLHGQMYTETESWYDTIMNEVMSYLSRILIYCEGAYDAGQAELTEEASEQIEQNIAALRYDAAALYGEELTSYLQRYYGKKITEADYREALRLQAISGAYSGTLNTQLEAGISAEEALSYAKAHNLEDGTPARRLAYLTVSGSTEQAVAENLKAARTRLIKLASASPEAKAEALAGLTECGTYSEEEFLILENTGIEPIREWLFDSARKVGDLGEVTDQGTTYLLIYVGDSERSRGEMLARMQLFDARYAEWYNALVGKLNFGYNYDIIDSYDVE